MRFKCNFCTRQIIYQYWGQPEINCSCGAKYTKTVTVEIKESS